MLKHTTIVLRIQLIFKRNRILDPPCEKTVLSISLTFTDIFFRFFLCLKIDIPFRDQEIFSILITVQIWDLSVKQGFFLSFWLIFCPLDLDPCICIFRRIRIQEAKILWILSTVTYNSN